QRRGADVRRSQRRQHRGDRVRRARAGLAHATRRRRPARTPRWPRRDNRPLAHRGRGPVITWYLTRAAGGAAIVLLTATVMLGIADVRRWSTRDLPRFVVDGLHRTVALLAVVMLALHIGTAVLDGFAPITVADAVIPFGSAYRPLWLGFGALAFDLLLALTVTSLLRARIGLRAWRATHWAAYACWPLALIHGLGSGSDVKAGWMLWLSLACTAGVVVAVLVRTAGAARRG